MMRDLTLSTMFLFWLPLWIGSGSAQGGSAAAVPLPPAVAEIVNGFSGELSFAAKNLSSGKVLEFQADRMVQTASVIKVPIMVTAFAQVDAGTLSLSQPLRLGDENRVPGSGILQDLGSGLTPTLRDVITLMIVLSDNTATNMVIDAVSVRAVNKWLETHSFHQTFLNRKVFQDAGTDLDPERAKWGLGGTTPREMLRLFEQLYRREIVSAEACTSMLEILKKQRDLEQIPRYLAGPKWEGVSVAHKTGALNQVRNDVGIVFTPQGDYILSLFAQKSADQKWTADNEATLALARLSVALLESLAE